MTKKRVGVDLDPELYEKLERHANDRGLPVALVVRTLIDRAVGDGAEHETIKAATVRMLRQGYSNDRIVEELTERFGSANRSSISWYRSRLRAEGDDVPTHREALAGEASASS